MGLKVVEILFLSVAAKLISCGPAPVKPAALMTVETLNESGGTSIKMSTLCTNGRCEMCVSGKCYKSETGSFSQSFIQNNCPSAFTFANCTWAETDNKCPMGKCKGFGTKEPCYSPSDCGATATSCLDSLCRYPEPLGPAMTSCSFAYDCQPNEDCVGGKCKAQSSGKHLTGQVCTFDRDCPETHRCDRMKLTCYEGGKQHKTGITCVFNYQCPSGYYCDQMTCYEGGPAHSQQVCVMDDQCDKGQVCKNMTCTQE